MTSAYLPRLVLAAAIVVVHASALGTYPGVSMPDTAELVESALAPFMAFDGGKLYTSHRRQDHSAVCGAVSATDSRLMFPVTLNDLDRLHGRLFVQDSEQNTTERQSELDMVEGCYVRSDGDNMPCVVSLESDPVDCGMNIKDSTAYWAYRRSAPVSSASAEALDGGADSLVENILRVSEQRERLRRSIKRTQDSAAAGKMLWSIVSRGWAKNALAQDQQAFAEAMSARGAAILRGSYADVMEKWDIVKQWMKVSVGETDVDAPVFTTKDGSLLNPDVYCNPTIYLDDWLAFFDQENYGYIIASGVDQEVQAFLTGYKIFENKTRWNVSRIGRLPCVAVSYLVAMMLLEDFPVRLAYWDMVNETGAKDAIWPLRRFEMLGDANGTLVQNRKNLAQYFDMMLSFITKVDFVNEVFNGSSAMAACVAQAILRAPGTDGAPPPSSIYQCISALRGSTGNGTRVSGVPKTNSDVLGLEKDDDLTKISCPWGYVRPSGNSWNTLEDCVMCPPGSFDDGDGGCRCSSRSFPGINGCLAKEGGMAPSPSWEWLVDPSEVLFASGDAKPFLVVSQGTGASEGDKVVVKIRCTEGLTRFEVSMPLTGSSMPKSERFDIPLQRVVTIMSLTNISVSLRSSAAFGGEQCEFTVVTNNPKYQVLQAVRAGTVVIMPSVANLPVVGHSHVESSASSMSEAGLPLCNSVPRAEPGVVMVAVCVTTKEELFLLVDAKGYAPLTTEMFRIFKQALWMDGTRATALGKALQLLGERTHLAVRVMVKRGSTMQSALKFFDGSFSLAKDVYKLFLVPGSLSQLTVGLQVVDRCATADWTHEIDCAKAKLFFAPGPVSTRVFKLAGGNDTEDPVDSSDNHSPVPASEWWRGLLIALGVVDGVLVTTVGVLLATYLRRTLKLSECSARRSLARPNAAALSSPAVISGESSAPF
ncbi:hypothetical protein DQ04_00111160 [Trypanosoma grayi]|uniref:hypothetical protein n=1 Tax=Trypanosoma grayi TaxID=71804 RepID=UPI0004F3F768|nr:hypothetical protein DQ04_00111160 [Trypanosoma grayi]KEG15316.1 hypothetical protein DQ04_00111160 [Trypanosoma grayi]